MEYTGLEGNLPDGISLENDTASRSVRISGTAPYEGETEFALGFTSGGMRFRLNFRFVVKAGPQASGFPEARYMVPFGGERAALLPTGSRRREEDAV